MVKRALLRRRPDVTAPSAVDERRRDRVHDVQLNAMTGSNLAMHSVSAQNDPLCNLLQL